MSDVTTDLHCLNCGKSEAQAPLVALRYAGAPRWVCAQCMPVLIHEPQQIAAKLAQGD
ncbi:MAG: hypothetical protein R3C71_04740 [Candidatus Krumholzibacteriia bacterium]